jgi:hypothetical protein
VTKESAKFALEKVFRFDAAEILAAREKAKILHASHDIDAAGDQVELSVRQMLRDRLPAEYYVGQGHIVDHTWSQAGQFDCVIADVNLSPVLFRSENSTEYFSYESVYAVGEIKSGYYGIKDVESFVDKLARLQINLSRGVCWPAKRPIDAHTKIHCSVS